MSTLINDAEHEQTTEELLADQIKWLKVIAFLLGAIKGVDANGIYEDIE